MYKQEDDKRDHCLKILDQLAQVCFWNIWL